jgi:hypothetical protein
MMTHEQALDAVCRCAATVTVLSCPEAIEAYLELRGIPRDSDGTATAAACEDMPVPQDCQARAEGIAQGHSS